jgi:2-iminoacetate synthase ThiH
LGYRGEILLRTTQVPLAKLQAHAAALRDASHRRRLSYSRKVFIPLTKACRDVCHYCEFVPLPFVPMEAPIFAKGKSRGGPTLRECILMHAVSRLVLNPLVVNIQTSWIKLGIGGVKMCLAAGANDLGGTLINESISRAAGTQHGQELPPCRYAGHRTLGWTESGAARYAL